MKHKKHLKIDYLCQDKIKTKKFGSYLRNLRIKNKLLLRELASELGIDSAILSKIERGERNATKEQINKLCMVFPKETKKLKVLWLSYKIVAEIRNEEFPIEALKVAEGMVKYG